MRSKVGTSTKEEKKIHFSFKTIQLPKMYVSNENK